MIESKVLDVFFSRIASQPESKEKTNIEKTIVLKSSGKASNTVASSDISDIQAKAGLKSHQLREEIKNKLKCEINKGANRNEESNSFGIYLKREIKSLKFKDRVFSFREPISSFSILGFSIISVNGVISPHSIQDRQFLFLFSQDRNSKGEFLQKESKKRQITAKDFQRFSISF